jgi:hypothetical protein
MSRPRSIPDGLVLELSRATVLPGASAEADRWMAMLNDRLDECVATLDRERMAVEVVFRLRDGEAEHLYWVAIRGAGGSGLDLSKPIDRDHEAQARRTMEPGWVEAEPQVLMLPDPVRRAVLAWALRDRERVPHPVTATVRLASAGLHVIDRWADGLADALLDAGAGDPRVGGSLTGGRIEVRMTVDAEDLADAGVVAADLLREALRAAETPGVRVLGLSTEIG